MTCHEAAELISVLYDGETIPRTAAEHVGVCDVCRARLKEYMEIGVELRRVASLEFPEQVTPRIWGQRQRVLANWWRKGWEMMRIPRLAFASLLAGIVALSSGLVLVGVHAHTQGSVVMLKITQTNGQSTLCPLSTEDKKWDECGALIQIHAGNLYYKVKLLYKDGTRVELGVRTKLSPAGPGSFGPSTLENEPERHYSFEPGETLPVDVAGLGTMAVTGEWMDHMPSLISLDHQELDAGPDELRIVSPLLLKEKAVIGDLEGASTYCDRKGVVGVYFPGDGLYELSLSHIPDAVEGQVQLNRISFQVDGQSAVFLTGVPISRSEHVWVRHQADFQPSGSAAREAFLSSAPDIDQLLSRTSRKQ